jgi:hypothetical protein
VGCQLLPLFELPICTLFQHFGRGEAFFDTRRGLKPRTILAFMAHFYVTDLYSKHSRHINAILAFLFIVYYDDKSSCSPSKSSVRNYQQILILYYFFITVSNLFLFLYI